MDLAVALHLWMTLAVGIQSQLGLSQQTYVNNKQLDCYNDSFNYTTKGFECNGLRSSCQSYLTFRSAPPYYTTPVTISYLFSLQDSASLIASLNNISSDVSSIPPQSQLFIPVNCSCFGGQFYQHNASYTLKFSSETYFSVANDTYQGLSTCQALMSQNPYGDRNLSVGMRLQVPLRCACPTSNQTALGFRYLLTYMVTWGDTISSIAELFGVRPQSILDANQLSSTSIIFPFTPILVPLTTPPTTIKASPPPPVVSPPPLTPVLPSGGSSRKWTYVGVGLGAALLLIFAVSGFLFWYPKSKSRKLTTVPIPSKALQSDSSAVPPDSSTPWSRSAYGVIESLTLYKFHDLQLATDYFSEKNRIKGSVYKGSFKGDAAAVKVMKGDVSSEISILKKINHSNIIRLSGVCLYDANTYLVYEFAENGSLAENVQTLTWKQRVQIAHDVADALNYLHNYTNPPYIHKNLKTSNILLDANMRAKIANFGLARTLQNEAEGGLHLTRHVVGTQGYMAPEYMENGVITPKLDVFAFGVVILELLSGKEAATYDKNAREEMLSASICRVLEGDNVRHKLCGFMDPSLGKQYPLDLAFSLAQLAQTCISHDINARPSVSQVFISLSKILSSSLDWDPSLELPRL
ncbi:protein LYK5 [Ricinus communis]|uniref:Kinase, putative n=1 Tax=Ricinus communis TaxID=3988 RepID=B9R8W3_RICCO|nr:protein LYK5 [Ricinus communis]EEF52943.1 kinase, putative [Ricinus communis]|eukprot:XP_002510756.1 protein LYK5 [Ricinus communis]